MRLDRQRLAKRTSEVPTQGIDNNDRLPYRPGAPKAIGHGSHRTETVRRPSVELLDQGTEALRNLVCVLEVREISDAANLLQTGHPSARCTEVQVKAIDPPPSS